MAKEQAGGPWNPRQCSFCPVSTGPHWLPGREQVRVPPGTSAEKPGDGANEHTRSSALAVAMEPSTTSLGVKAPGLLSSPHRTLTAAPACPRPRLPEMWGQGVSSVRGKGRVTGSLQERACSCCQISK